MLSRVAETIYWIGRYLERAEDLARIVNVNGNLLLDLPKDVSLGWGPMVQILGCERAYAERHGEITERRVVNFVVSDLENPGSILNSLAAARENARTIREILPREGWEELNALYQELLESRQSSHARQGRHDYLRKIIRGVQLLTGLLAGTMNHDVAYDFLNLGRKLERADMTTRIINVRAINPIQQGEHELRPIDDTLWMSMLETLEAYQMYRQSMQSKINRYDILTFLFQHSEFPRSFAYCIENIAHNLSRLPDNGTVNETLAELDRIVRKTEVRQLDDLALHRFIDKLQVRLGRLHAAIETSYFPTLSDEVA